MDKCIVIDSGSDTLKIGYAGDSEPTVIPSVVGKSKIEGIDLVCYGQEAVTKRDMLNVKSPVKFGIIVDWDDMEGLWEYAMFDKLGATRGENPVCLTEVAYNPPEWRERMAQVMFERFEVPALYIANAEAMTLKFNNRTSGLVVESGYSVTRIVPVHEGQVISAAVEKLNFGGADLTNHLRELISIPQLTPIEILEDIKHNHCYVAEDCDFLISKLIVNPSSLDQKYELPDGTTLTLSDSLFKCPEVFFQPSLMGNKSLDLTAAILGSIRKCPASARDSLYNNTVLAGGSALFNGFAERLQNAIGARTPSISSTIGVIPARPYSAWGGASALASDPAIEAMWVTAQDFAEHGYSVVDRMR